MNAYFTSFYEKGGAIKVSLRLSNISRPKFSEVEDLPHLSVD